MMIFHVTAALPLTAPTRRWHAIVELNPATSALSHAAARHAARRLIGLPPYIPVVVEHDIPADRSAGDVWKEDIA